MHVELERQHSTYALLICGTDIRKQDVRSKENMTFGVDSCFSRTLGVHMEPMKLTY